jgi:hypothetical protein
MATGHMKKRKGDALKESIRIDSEPLTDNEVDSMRRHYAGFPTVKIHHVARTWKRSIAVTTYVVGNRKTAHECMMHLSSKYRAKHWGKV